MIWCKGRAMWSAASLKLKLSRPSMDELFEFFSFLINLFTLFTVTWFKESLHLLLLIKSVHAFKSGSEFGIFFRILLTFSIKNWFIWVAMSNGLLIILPSCISWWGGPLLFQPIISLVVLHNPSGLFRFLLTFSALYLCSSQRFWLFIWFLSFLLELQASLCSSTFKVGLEAVSFHLSLSFISNFVLSEIQGE